MATDKARPFSEDENENIRQAIRDLMTTRGWGQRGVADELQVKQQTVSAFMSGKYGAGFAMAQRLAEVLGVELDDLLSGSAAGAPVVSRVQFATRLESAVGRAFRHEKHLPRDIRAVENSFVRARGANVEHLDLFASEWLDAAVRLRSRDEGVDLESLLYEVTAQLLEARATVGAQEADRAKLEAERRRLTEETEAQRLRLQEAQKDLRETLTSSEETQTFLLDMVARAVPPHTQFPNGKAAQDYIRGWGGSSLSGAFHDAWKPVEEEFKKRKADDDNIPF